MRRIKLFIFSVLLLSFGTMGLNDAFAYTNEVRQSGSNYIWRINNADQGSTTNFATAINNCIGTGNREVHIICGGTLSAQINLQPGLTLYCHNNTFNKSHSGYGFFRDGSGPIKIYDLIFNNNSNMGIRISRASDIYIQNVKIYGGSIGIRVDSHPSRPYEDGRWVYNLHVQDCRFENTGSHGLETYGVDGFKAYGITARNCGECGVLLNKTVNGTIGTVNAYRCCYGGGYAGLRYANSCSNVTADMLYADECGRGYFVLTGSNNCHLKNCQITDCSNIGIWLENVVNCSVKAGCCNCGVSVSGSGSYANVSSSCGSSGGSYYQIKNRGTGLFIDGMGRTVNGDACGQWANTTHSNSKWEMISRDGYYQFRNVGTGLFLDGMGRTTNGDDAGQWANTTHVNSQWSVQKFDGDYVRIQNRGTGLFLDGMGRTTNGSACGQWANTTHYNAQWLLVSTVKSALIEDNNDKTEIKQSEELLLYPNPVIDVLNIDIPGEIKNAEVKIFDISGKMILNTLITVEKTEVDLSGLKTGIYMVQINNNNSSVTKKIIK
ncbi:MAG: RICIN domain-containing protein [Marinilabiliaceae bacterium]|nr:RICIN domain-containing protein [Marinilabiliaceae bacterium]